MKTKYLIIGRSRNLDALTDKEFKEGAAIAQMLRDEELRIAAQNRFLRRPQLVRLREQAARLQRVLRRGERVKRLER